MQKLAKSHTADMNHVPLRDALSMIADGAGVDVVIDERAAADIGVDVQSETVTLHVQPRPMEQILSLTLRLTNPQLDYSIYNGVVFVSSREALNRRIVTRIYDLPSSVDRAAMMQMIASVKSGVLRATSSSRRSSSPRRKSPSRDVARIAGHADRPGAAAGGNKSDVPFPPSQRAKAAEVAAKFPKELVRLLPTRVRIRCWSRQRRRIRLKISSLNAIGWDSLTREINLIRGFAVTWPRMVLFKILKRH